MSILHFINFTFTVIHTFEVYFESLPLLSFSEIYIFYFSFFTNSILQVEQLTPYYAELDYFVGSRRSGEHGESVTILDVPLLFYHYNGLSSFLL